MYVWGVCMYVRVPVGARRCWIPRSWSFWWW